MQALQTVDRVEDLEQALFLGCRLREVGCEDVGKLIGIVSLVPRGGPNYSIDFEGERVIQRVTVMGDQPEAARSSEWEPFHTAFQASTWRDQPLRKFIADRDA